MPILQSNSFQCLDLLLIVAPTPNTRRDPLFLFLFIGHLIAMFYIAFTSGIDSLGDVTDNTDGDATVTVNSKVVYCVLILCVLSSAFTGLTVTILMRNAEEVRLERRMVGSKRQQHTATTLTLRPSRISTRQFNFFLHSLRSSHKLTTSLLLVASLLAPCPPPHPHSSSRRLFASISPYPSSSCWSPSPKGL